VIRTTLYHASTGEKKRGGREALSEWLNNLVIRHAEQSVSIDSVWSSLEGGNANIARGSAHLAYCVLRKVTDRYSSLMERMENRLDPLEEEMFGNPRDALSEDLMGYGRNLKKLRRIFNYQKSLFAQLSSKGHPFIGKEERHEFIDAFEHTEPLASLTELYKELTDDLMNGYISITSH
jgi:magnesium transporter